MVTDRVRKKKIRAHMAATGDPYTLAARAIEIGVSYLDTRWSASPWPRLLPLEAMDLQIVVATATVTGQDGDLAELLAAHPVGTRFPDGADTALCWVSADTAHSQDDESLALRKLAESSFRTAVVAIGRDVPATLGDLAELLVELGVYEHHHRPNGTHQWRAARTLPSPADVLPMPANWLEQEDRVHWITRTSGPSFELRDLLIGQGRPSHVTTTLQRLAQDGGMSLEAVRHAIDGLMYRFAAVVERHGERIDRQAVAALPEHARITLLVDWEQLGAHRDSDDGPGTAEDEDPGIVQWGDSPWQVCEMVSQHPDFDQEAVGIVAHMPFRMKKPGGGTFVTKLAEMAAYQGTSVSDTAHSLIELEHAGLLCWHQSEQMGEMFDMPVNRAATRSPSSSG